MFSFNRKQKQRNEVLPGLVAQSSGQVEAVRLWRPEAVFLSRGITKGWIRRRKMSSQSEPELCVGLGVQTPVIDVLGHTSQHCYILFSSQAEAGLPPTCRKPPGG